MRSPSLPVPQAAAAMQDRANSGKSSRRSASDASTNRRARRTTPSHDGAPTHKAARRKGAAAGSVSDQTGAGFDFAAMLAQNAASPVGAAPAAVAGDAASGTNPLGAGSTASASALLRPWEALTTAVQPGTSEATGGKLGKPDAAAVDGASTAGVGTPVDPTAAGDAPALSELGAAAAGAGSPIAVPSELVPADAAINAKAADVAATGAHRADARAATHLDQPSGTGAAGTTGMDLPDVAAGAGAVGADTARGGAQHSAGDGSSSGQPQPEPAGNALAAGLPSSPTGITDKVSDAPIPAHTLAPTLAQVAQSLHTSGNGTSRLVIRLDPVELGPVLVSLRTRGGAVDISVRADNAGGAAAVADQRAHIQQVLAEHGLDLSSFNVSGGESSGGAGSSTADSGMPDSSADGSPNGNGGTDASAASYEEVQAQASGSDGQAGERRTFAAPRDDVGGFRTNSATSSDAAAAPIVRTTRREGTWL